MKGSPSLPPTGSHPDASGIPDDFDLRRLQIQLLHCQQAAYCQGKRVVIVFEGTDTAGKGGTIRRLVRQMDPRGYRVFPIGPPDLVEKHQHYLQRFWQRLPQPGELVIFDRSWYGRVLVERVEELAEPEVWQRAYKEIRQFETMLVDDGILLIKCLLVIDEQEQRRRLIQRLRRPEKRWKVTESDLVSYQLFKEYRQAMADMLVETSRAKVPWHVIPANNKPYARYRCLTDIAEMLGDSVDVDKVALLDPQLEARAKQLLDDEE